MSNWIQLFECNSTGAFQCLQEKKNYALTLQQLEATRMTTETQIMYLEEVMYGPVEYISCIRTIDNGMYENFVEGIYFNRTLGASDHVQDSMEADLSQEIEQALKGNFPVISDV